jgi:hypothetical protein
MRRESHPATTQPPLDVLARKFMTHHPANHTYVNKKLQDRIASMEMNRHPNIRRSYCLVPGRR